MNRLSNYESNEAEYALRLRTRAVAEGKKFWQEALQIDSQPQHLRPILKKQAAMYAELRIDPMVLQGYPMRRLDEFDWNRPLEKESVPEVKPSRLMWRETPHGEINPVNGLKVGIPEWLGRPD